MTDPGVIDDIVDDPCFGKCKLIDSSACAADGIILFGDGPEACPMYSPLREPCEHRKDRGTEDVEFYVCDLTRDKPCDDAMHDICEGRKEAGE